MFLIGYIFRVEPSACLGILRQLIFIQHIIVSRHDPICHLLFALAGYLGDSKAGLLLNQCAGGLMVCESDEPGSEPRF